MIDDLQKWLQSQIKKHTETLNSLYTKHNIDRKQLMATNAYLNLPNECLIEIYSIDTYAKVFGFLNFQPEEEVAGKEKNATIVKLMSDEVIRFMEEQGTTYASFKDSVGQTIVPMPQDEALMSLAFTTYTWYLLHERNKAPSS